MRLHSGKLISATNNHPADDHLDNVFVNSNKGGDAYTLSVYNRASKYRPQTAPA